VPLDDDPESAASGSSRIRDRSACASSMRCARKRRNPDLGRDFDEAAEGIRTLDLLHGKQTL
jgi:hypothetical protein